MLSIQTNVNSMNAQENLRVTNQFQGRTITRLTSGYRINESGDDAAGLAVANKYRSDVTELQQGVRNANDGLSTLQIIDGGLSNISKMLDRLKTLSTQSASVTFTGNRDTLDQEFQQLLTEVDRQAANVGLGKTASGAAGVGDRLNNKSIDVYVGGGKSMGNSKVTVDLSSGVSQNNQVDSNNLGILGTKINGGFKYSGSNTGTYTSAADITVDGTTIDLNNDSDATEAVNAINAAMQTAGKKIFAVLHDDGNNFDIYSASGIAIRSTIANDTSWTGVDIGTDGGDVDAPGTAAIESYAQASITMIGKAVEKLGQVQGKVGTGQNQLGYAIQLAQSQITSFSAAESRIRDADVASEAANLTKAQVLQQASLAALAQANSAPQAVLSLLRG